MKNLLTIVCLMGVMISFGQKKKKEDEAAILDMCGCHEVRFNFAETFAVEKDYEYYDNYTSGGLEWVFPVEQTKDKIVLQHLLVVGDTMIIKHWRQDWLYENTDLYVYDKDDTWKYKSLDESTVKGQWTQKVFQVDDSPRYDGSGSWVHYDGRHYWESVADAPLPRREYSQRSDYNVMVRRNRQEITEDGWVHEQDNQKVQREGGEDQLLAWEKGWNIYKKVEDSKCQVAVEWWGENQAYWADVRAVWEEVFASKKTVKINMKADGKIMFMRLFELGDSVKGEPYDSMKTKEEIRAIINMHLDGDEIKLASK